MFDGLKEKLGRFSSDVEEDVDEDAVEEDAEATEQTAGENPEGVEEDRDESSASGTVEQAADAETAEREPTREDAAGDGSADSEGVNRSPEADREPTADTESETPGDEETPEQADKDDSAPASQASEDADDAAEDADRGLAEKAKLFATGKTVIDEDDLEGHLDDLEIALLQSDVEMDVAQEILEGVKANLTGETRRRLESTGNIVRDALREALYDVISVGQFDFDRRIAEAEKPIVIVFTGVNGVGKTTSIAKLSHYLEGQGFSSVLANGDTYRAGANEQLREHAENLDRTFISHEQGSDPTAVIYDAVEYAEANDIDVVLGDTAGRLHTSDDLMAQLEKIDRVIEPDMTMFVDEAVAGQDAVNRAREFDAAAEVDGTILTKADADPQGGAAISIAHVTGKPILFLGTGQDYNDLERFDPETIVDRLLEE
ncbi:signal recognition particle-docking protein FtsY [Halapricum desulfuricans]|uniref:Signal recognition particle receptor FtsY n=1 Tax=Halapricum desulfuricans TaxID=2841257 RepID=A0A897N4R0_9EURY|nr:signal recognition particle-docking protein FtsY [Halapricum desulfuricans]QSG05855.1 Signal recognition particle GTPase [Halapricum desulfuricans]